MEKFVQSSFLSTFRNILPSGAGALFFIQIFSTLAFSVLYSTLVLYATHSLKFSDIAATGITASFVAFNYALHLLGGYIGGRFLSYRTLFSLGMVCQLAGCILLSFPSMNTFYWGLAAFLAGSGLNVTCINCMLTQLFQPQDRGRETAFLWNYSGMNVGFFIGFTMSGYFQLSQNYSLLFILSGLGNLIALVITLLKWRSLGDRNTKLVGMVQKKQKLAYLNGFVSILFLLLGLRWLLEHAQLSNNLIMMVGMGMLFLFFYIAMKQPTQEQRSKIWAFIILALTSLVFWTLYQLAPMGLTLFIERNVDRHFLGFIIAPQWVQNINTIVIILGGPLLTIVFSQLRDRGIQLTVPVQFSMALILIGVAFAILPLGIYFANEQGLCHFNWILACYILISAGELFSSPIGYAMIGQLAPVHLQGVMMGTWMMITGVSATLSGYFSNMALGSSTVTDPLLTNPSFSHTFNLLGWTSIATGVGLCFLVPFLLRLTQEKKFFEKSSIVVNGIS